MAPELLRYERYGKEADVFAFGGCLVNLATLLGRKDIYEPEKVVALRMVKGGITQYQVKWVGSGTPMPDVYQISTR